MNKEDTSLYKFIRNLSIGWCVLIWGAIVYGLYYPFKDQEYFNSKLWIVIVIAVGFVILGIHSMRKIKALKGT